MVNWMEIADNNLQKVKSTDIPSGCTLKNNILDRI